MPKPSLISSPLTRLGRGVLSGIAIALLAGCSTAPAESAQPPLAQGPGMQLTRYSYAQIPGWDEGDQQLALVALRRSCNKIVERAPLGVQHDPRAKEPWLNSCRAVLASGELTSAWEVRRLLEAQFTPYAVTFNGNPQGLFTGYYQPTIQGSLQPTAYFDVPLYGVPRSLKRMRWQDGSMRTVWWQDGHYTLLPSRADIVAGPLLPNTPVLAWVHDQVDRYFLQVQGSGTILLTDGRELPVGYAAQNGYPYYPIGRYLLQIGAIPLKQMSMQTIRAWLKEHPAQVTMILNMDPSFVFFRITRHEEPIGAQSVPLTPGRSLAVDLNYIWLGTPIWLDTAYPNPGHNNVPGAPLRRLMIAQDTGGAIQGAVRGDVFWGSGDQATFLAGHMQSTGRYWLLLPKGLTPEGYRA